MKMKNKYKAKGASMLKCPGLSVVIVMAEKRRYIKIIKVQVICTFGD